MQSYYNWIPLISLIVITSACNKNETLIDENSNENIEIPNPEIPYSIVDTGVFDFYNNTKIISEPNENNEFYGQDATYDGNQPSYTENNNGTITDNVTGLMWEKEMGDKITFEEAFTKASNSMFFRMVRGNTNYGTNNFIDNGDGTISDLATGLMWQKADDGISKNWKESLVYAENLTLGNGADWRLPNAKELQSIVDYNRSPQTTNSPAINPIFETTEILDPDGNSGQYPFYWTGTTHLDGVNPYSGAVYIAFGEGQGEMNNTLMDVHGAGCQRSDPKSGNENDYPKFFGPQGDVQYVYNYVRCVRSIE